MEKEAAYSCWMLIVRLRALPVARALLNVSARWLSENTGVFKSVSTNQIWEKKFFYYLWAKHKNSFLEFLDSEAGCWKTID